MADQFADKKNLALAQFGNLPDGLFNAGMNDYDLLRYAKQGIIIPVEHLIDKYMPNLKAIFEKYPEYRTMCTAPDGHIYSFPWIEQLGDCLLYTSKGNTGFFRWSEEKGADRKKSLRTGTPVSYTHLHWQIIMHWKEPIFHLLRMKC